MRKYYISGYAWVPSYRDFDSWDTTIEATSKEDARERFKEHNMYKFFKYEPCVQTEKEWGEMHKRIKEKYG